jgi:hypothetical protein
MYTSENFLWAARKYGSADIRDDVIEEVRQRLEDQRRSGRSSGQKPEELEPHSQKPRGAVSGIEDKPSRPAESSTGFAKGDTQKPEAEVEGGE